MALAIDDLLRDPAVMEIMINGYQQVLIERNGKVEEFNTLYRDEAHLLADIDEIITPLGLRLNESTPILDARLPDGSIVNIVGFPIALNGASVTIMRGVNTMKRLTIEDTVGFGAWTNDMVSFVRACVLSGQNIMVAGGTGSGKTTMGNLIAGMIPPEERIVVCQNAPIMVFNQPRVVILEARPANLEGKGEISLSQLLKNVTRMRPDRIIVPEVTGKEAAALMEAVNSGFDGALMTMHATGIHNALERFESYILTGSPTMPILSAREAMANGIQYIIYQERLPGGPRRITRITEIIGMEAGGILSMQDIFEFRQTGMENGRTVGYHTGTGLIPRRLGQMRDMGINIDMEIFAPKRG